MVVVSGLDEVRRLEMELEENIHRKDFTPEEVLEGWKKLDRLRHPPLSRRIGLAVRAFFGRLCFWRRKKKPAAESAAPVLPPPETNTVPATDDDNDIDKFTC